MVKHIFLVALAFALFISISGCHKNQTFDREKWNMGDGLTFPVRDMIVNDLVQNHKLKGLKYLQVRHLLRYPQYRDSTKLSYEIIETHTNMLKPDHIKSLILYMTKDSVITKVEIYDNKANPKSTFY